MTTTKDLPEQRAGGFYLAMGALSAALAVTLGAFAAHALRGSLSAGSLATFETGVRYQMYHAIGLLIVGILYRLNAGDSDKALVWTGRFFISGTVLFSGSLYVLTTVGLHWLRFVTPLGGLLWIAGWGILGFASWRKLPRKAQD